MEVYICDFCDGRMEEDQVLSDGYRVDVSNPGHIESNATLEPNSQSTEYHGSGKLYITEKETSEYHICDNCVSQLGVTEDGN